MNGQQLIDRLAHLSEPGAVLDLPGQILRYQDLPSHVLEKRQQRGLTENELERRARAAAPDPSIFDEEGRGLFFFPATICTGNIVECYGLQMRRSSLERMASNAEEGRVLHVQHERDDSPLGRSISGTFVDGRGKGFQSTIADFYIPRGINLVLRSGQGGFLSFAASPREVSTNTYIDLIRAGNYPDMSVGWEPGQIICNLDSLEMFPHNPPWFAPDPNQPEEPEAECLHLPNYDYYAVDKKTGKTTGEKVRCIGLLENSGLIETSVVDDGAAPGSVVGASTAGLIQFKAQMLAEAGRLPPEQRDWFQQQFRRRIYTRDRFWSGFSPPININQTAAQLEVLAEPIARKVLSAIGFNLNPEIVDAPGGASDDETMISDPETAAEQLAAEAENRSGAGSEETEQEVSMPDKQVLSQPAEQSPAEKETSNLSSLEESNRRLAEQNAALAERVAAMEAKEQRLRFEKIVLGNGSSTRWPGSVEQHVKFLTSLARAFGEESEEFTGHVQQQSRVAQQVNESEALSIVGSDAFGRTGSAYGQMREEAQRLHESQPEKYQTVELAMVEVNRRRQDLSQQAHREFNERAGHGARMN